MALGIASNVLTVPVAAQPAPGLVAAYSFNEGTGTTVGDLSGNGNTGTLTSTTWTTAGKYGNALSFNGTSSFVNLGNPTQLRLTGSSTWSAWVNAAANPADDGQIIAKSSDTSGWQFKTSPDTGPHTFGVAISGSGGSHAQRYSTTIRQLNTWYYVAGVYNAAARTLDIYVNGVLDNGALIGTVPSSQTNNNSVNVNIGRRSGGFYFNGIIDEVRIYNRALSQAEIQADMNTPLGAPGPDTQPPTAPTNLTAAAAGSQINLSWTASTDNVAVTGYIVERCQGVGCSSFTQIATPAANSYSDPGLAVGSYSYRVRARDAAGNQSSNSSVATAAIADTTAPTAPASLSANVAGTQINLGWTASTDNVAVTAYLVERCQGVGCSNFAQIGTSATNSYSDPGLGAGTYGYRVRAADAAGNLSLYSNTAYGLVPDTQAPTAPATLTATAVGAQINLSWAAATDNVAVTGYFVERCAGSGCANFSQIATPATTSYGDPGLEAGSYSYRVRAGDAAGNQGPYSPVATAVVTDTQAPTAPSSLTATVNGAQIDLVWAASSDNIGVTGYRVERCQGASCSNFAQIATPTATSYSDPGLGAGNYSYRVRAADAAGNLSGYSNVASGAIPDTQAPTAPGTLTATAAGAQVNLSWGAATDNVAVTGYLLERCQGPGCANFAQIATPSGTTYTDPGLAIDTYSYRVRATDAASNPGPYSNIATATTTDAQAPTAPSGLTAGVAGTQINLSWTASTDNIGVTEYRVERCQGPGCANFAQIANPATTSYSDPGLGAGSYSYRVRAADAAGNLSGYSNTASGVIPDTQAPTAPTALTATATGAQTISLSWTASTDNVAVTGYQLDRCSGVGCSTFVQLSPGPSGTGTTFNDTGLSPNTSYSYRLRAVDAAANVSGNSNTASATTLAAISGLVAAYAFDEGSGTTVSDASGHGITGTINGATWATAGKYGKALSFNGSTSYVDLGNPTSLQLTGSMTLSAWINAAANPADDGQIVAKSNDSTGWQFKTSPDTGTHTFGVAVSNASGAHIQRYSALTRSLNTWYHVAAVYDATAQTLNIYVNGALNNGSLLGGAVPNVQANAAVNVNIGRRTGGYYFNGLIDEVRIYNRALSLAEIQSDMITPLGVPDTQAPTAPTALTANAPAGSQIDLSWTASTDNTAVTGYLLERCQGAGCSSFAAIPGPSGAVTTFSDTGLTADTSYSYRVRATDAANNLSAYSNVATAVTPVPDTQPPSAPGTLTAATVSGTQIDVSWGAATDNVGVTMYRLERCQGATCVDFARIANPTGLTYSDTGLLPNTTYRYQVRAQDAAVNLGPYSNIGSATTLATIPGLISAYGFGEGSGTLTADSSGNGNTGTLNAAAWTANGKYGSALTFNGSTAFVDLGNPASLQLNSSMTVSAWVYATANPGDDGQIVAKSNDSAGWQFKTSPDTGTHKFAFAVATSNGGRVQRNSNITRVLNTWYHVAAVYNAAAQTMDIYVNGVLDNGVLSGTVPTAQLNAAVNANIGRRTGGYYFIGTIDEVRIYNRALSAIEIQSDMNTPIGTGSLPTLSLSTAGLTFTSQGTGTVSAPQPVTITNTGTIAVAFSSITITGTNALDFSQTNTCGTTLAAGANCTVNVSFGPTATGARSATLTVADNAAGNPHTVSLNGTGAPPGLSISPRVTVLTATRTQQFTGSGSAGSLTWLVDGAVGGTAATGTISSTGLYTPPATQGTHTITATDGTQSANATAYISNNPGVFTYHNDNFRSGVNSNEFVLSPGNVNSAQFGKLFSYNLDGHPYASPLYVANVNIPGQGFHNVVYVATEHDTLYAFDADGLSASPLWTKSFLSQGVTTVPANDTGECCDIQPEIGITGTPVIDPATATLYVVVKTKENGNNYFQKLHAIDITNGAEKFGGPVTIQASVPGTGSGSSGGQVPFNALRHNQRPALLLNNGVIYIAWAAHGDQQPWHGWVIGYNAATLQQTMAFNATPNSYGGGIWLSGGGLATDSTGNIFFTTANGSFNANTGGSDYGDTVLKLSPAGTVVDYFTPHDAANLESQNIDLASSGPVLLLDQPGPNPHLLITGGKGGTVYVINRDNMGHFNASNDNNIVQSLVNIFPNGVPEPGNYMAPVYFNGTVFFSPVNDTLQAFRLTNGTLSQSPASRTAVVFEYPGGAFSISANGTAGGVLWAVQRSGGSVTSSNGPGTLRAYDPANLTTELYNSNQAGTRDTLDIANKFTVPVIANGKVFVGTDSKLMVYGLLP
jgi:fibronectin type 3 domain-containing protein